MTDTIPNLWPEDFKVDVQSPYSILQVQAGLLGKMTRGILQGTVETETTKERLQNRLVVIAPAYNGYRHTLITALQHPKLPYPVEVRAEGLETRQKREDETSLAVALSGRYMTVYPTAYDDAQMTRLVQNALRSDSTRAIILSLIANSNELNARPSPDANGNGLASQESTPDESDDGSDSVE